MNFIQRPTTALTAPGVWQGYPGAVIQPSPNVSPRNTARHPNPRIRYLIWHATGGPDAHHALNVLADPARNPPVSSHYLILPCGTVVQLVDEKMKAWHAGVSAYGNDIDINPLSIGAEMVSDDKSPASYTPMQIDSGRLLTADIQNRYGIAPENVLGHHHIAPGRKTDPAHLNLDLLRCHGPAVLPEMEGLLHKSSGYREIERN